MIFLRGDRADYHNFINDYSCWQSYTCGTFKTVNEIFKSEFWMAEKAMEISMFLIRVV